MILAIFLAGLLVISAVSAEDNAAADVAGEGTDESDGLSSVDESLTDSTLDDDLGAESSDFNSGEEMLASDPRVPNNFTYIDWEIDGFVANQTINLSGYFEVNPTDFSPIEIQSVYDYENTLTINGKGLILDAKDSCGIIAVFGTNLVLNNITFLNSGHDNIGEHGEIGISSSNAVFGDGTLTVRDCTFVNCYSGTGGGAINWYGNCSFFNCSFVNCSSFVNGGAIYNTGNCSVSNCSFVNCYSRHEGEGGAIYCSGNANINDCSFSNCSTGSAGTAIYDGGAISCRGSVNIANCAFSKCLATRHGGAINLMYSSTNISDCSFEDCHSEDNGGVIYSLGGNDNVWNCSFVCCTAGSAGTVFYKGGAIYFDDGDSSVSDCSFVNCSSTTDGGAIFSDNGNYSISDCRFVNCSSANGGAIFSDYNYFNLENGEKFKFTVSNSSFLACFAEDCGGGIYFTYNESEMIDCYFRDNTAKNGSDWYSEYDIENIITRVSTSIDASKVTVAYGVSKDLIVTLKDADGNALSGKEVKMILNGKTYYKNTTSEGKASFAVANNLAPKSYGAEISFAGDSKYISSSKISTVTVKKATPKLTAKAKSFKKSVKTKKYAVTLKTNKNKVMKNTKLTIKVNKKTYTAKTNNKGQATFKITKLTKKGKYTATVKYAGSKYYNAKSVKVKITVK